MHSQSRSLHSNADNNGLAREIDTESGDASQPLLKTFRSKFGLLCEPLRDLVACAILFTNDYNGMKWERNPGSGDMYLPGLDKDRENMERSLPVMFPGIQVTLFEKTMLNDIRNVMTNMANVKPATILITLQGHEQNGHYVTADGHYSNSDIYLKVLTSKDLCTMLFELGPNTWRILLSDFCRSGNHLRLRFMLVVDGEDALWVETDEWKYRDPNDTDTNNAPTLHFSACTEQEFGWSSSDSGGYKTKAFTSPVNQGLTLPKFLTAIRTDVKARLSKAREDPESRIQTPQIYSSHDDLPLDDPKFLSRFYFHEYLL